MNKINVLATEMLLKILAIAEHKNPGIDILNVSDLERDIDIEIKTLLAKGIIREIDGPLIKITISKLIDECVENDFSNVGSMRVSVLSNHDNLIKLVEESFKKQAYIVCSNEKRAHEIMNVARGLKLSIPFPITVKELPIQSIYIEKVLVDDIESVLTRAIGKPIDIATLNKN